MTPPDRWKPAVEAAAEHALDAYPHEACGLIVEDDGPEYVRCENHATFPRRSFELDPLRYIELVDSGRPPIAIVHSHPDGTTTLSRSDLLHATMPTPQGRRPAFPGLSWVILASRRSTVDAVSAYDWNGDAGAFEKSWSYEL